MATQPITRLNLAAAWLADIDGAPIYRARFISEGAVLDRNGDAGDLHISAEALRELAARGALVGAAMFPRHATPGAPPDSAETCAVVESAALVTLADGRLALEGTLRFWPTVAGQRQRAHTDAWLAARAAGAALPDQGLSLSVHIAQARRGADGALMVLRFGGVESVDFVHKPGAGGRVLGKVDDPPGADAGGQGDATMNVLNHNQYSVGSGPADAAPAAEALALAALPPASTDDPTRALSLQLEATIQSAALELIAAAGLPRPVALRLSAQRYGDLAQARVAVQQARDELAAILATETVQLGTRPAASGARVEVQGYEHEIRRALEWTFGLASAPLPAPHLRRPANLYVAATGDAEWSGRVDLAATTASLPALTADALNKVIVQQFEALAFYRWYEAIAAVQPNDGSLHAMQWVQYGGQGDLPTVAEGAAYTELTFGDTQESASFVKYGGYIAVTEEAFRNSRLAELRAIPVELTSAAIMTRSAQFAALFTANSGTGPLLAQDGKALFHSDHGNLYTGALSAAAWKAVRALSAKQARIGNSKRLMVYPRICLVPVDLYDDALVLFGYGAGPGGYPGTANNDVNPFAMNRPNDPKPVVIAVPEWTDTNNWAWLADPALNPVIQVSYDGGDGRTHRPPQVVAVTDARAGLVFSNDAMPFKVKDRYAFGVSGYRGIGKSNVAGG